jgi:hypothetical protein
MFGAIDDAEHNVSVKPVYSVVSADQILVTGQNDPPSSSDAEIE